jgi:ribosomal protein L11 methyltransferase
LRGAAVSATFAVAMLRIAALVPLELADAATGLFYQAGFSGVLAQDPGDLGTEVDPVPAGKVRIVAFASVPSTAERARELLWERLEVSASIASFTPTDWMRDFRAHHRVVQVGRSLAIAPPWSRLKSLPGRRVVRIDPGLAFGTGTHASTYLCLRALVDLARRRRLGRVLDIGTGSGVLAFAAGRLGAAQVRAIDPDPEALAAAHANARRNRLLGKITITKGSAATVRGRYDLVLANLLRDLLLRDAGHIAARVAVGGDLVVSGILDRQAEEIREAFRSRGLVPARGLWREGWCALVFSRPRASTAR